MKRGFNVGDRVLWRGEWGRADAAPATILEISGGCPGPHILIEKSGWPTKMDTAAGWAPKPIYLLDNGCQAYAEQLSPIK